MLTPLDVASAFTQRFAAVVAGRTAPNGKNLISPVALYNRAYAFPIDPNDDAKTPYATFTVKGDAVEQFGGATAVAPALAFADAFLADYRVRCRVTCDADWASTPAAVQTALTVDWQTKWGERAGWVLPADHYVTVCRPGATDFDLWPGLRNGSDSTFFDFELLLQIAGTL